MAQDHPDIIKPIFEFRGGNAKYIINAFRFKTDGKYADGPGKPYLVGSRQQAQYQVVRGLCPLCIPEKVAMQVVKVNDDLHVSVGDHPQGFVVRQVQLKVTLPVAFNECTQGFSGLIFHNAIMQIAAN
jgi:hypothetical protein